MSKLDRDWPPRGDEPDGDETEVRAPAGEGSRADSIKEQARLHKGGHRDGASPDFTEAGLIVLALLEVSAAIDRLTVEVRRKD